ncbi:MAG: hypothetical protein MUF64_10565 [Polyangiaceae bacterium]|nr:hypothetical protein [Polyangiaceae bacterium]
MAWGVGGVAWGQGLPPPGQPKTERSWAQYGVALVSEGRLRAGGLCPEDAIAPCILGSGGGLTLRGGRRIPAGWYLGGSYSFSKQDAANLLRLPILQQVRVEGRYYLLPGNRLEPYAAGALGGVIYGGEWGLETYGGVASLGIGVEYETSRGIFFGGALHYRVMRLEGWRDKAGQERPDALAHFLSLELTLEARTPVERW